MSASRAADGSVLRTGLSQFALSIAAFGTLAAGAVGAGMTVLPTLTPRLTRPSTGALTATSATAGAQTLPANPAGFLTITIGGTQYKVPYYNN